MTTSEYEGLSLEEKEKYWLEALRYKSKDDLLTDEQWWFEWEPQTLYEDENILFDKNYVNELGILNKKKDIGLTGCFEVMVAEDLGGELIKLDGYEGKTIVDYMRDRGFPLTFLTWT